jgi:hypothetical protein
MTDFVGGLCLEMSRTALFRFIRPCTMIWDQDRHAVAFLLTLFSVFLTVSASGNCTLAREPLILISPSGSSIFQGFGSYGLLLSAIDGQEQPDSFVTNITLMGLAERNKANPAYECLIPNGPGTTPFDVFG